MTKQKQITLSHSQKQLFKQCKRKWYLKYEKELDDGVKSEALVFDSFVHTILEQYMKSQHSLLSRYIQFNVVLQPIIDEVYDNLEDKEILGADAKYLALRLTTQALRILQKDFKEIFIFDGEPAIELQLTVDGFYTGIIDLIYIDKQDNLVLLDWKTSSKPYTNHQVRQATQLKGYAWLLEQNEVSIDTLAYCVLNKRTQTAQLKKVENNRNYKSFVKDTKETRIDIGSVYLHPGFIRGRQPIKFFRKNEEVCFAYNTVCPFYDHCWSEDVRTIETIDLVPKLN